MSNTTLIVSEGNSAVLECKLDQRHDFSWIGPSGRFPLFFIFGLEINDELSNRIKLVGNINKGEYNMQIDNVTEKDEGVYKCVDGNSKGSTLDVTFVTLTVQGNYI